jgi:hypothetical protein
VRFLAWAVKERNLASLLTVKDDKGLTPLALAAKCQADLLRPIFAHQDGHERFRSAPARCRESHRR